MCRLPLRRPVDIVDPALSLSPGYAPTHEERCLSEGKLAAVAPTSAMLRRIHSQAGHVIDLASVAPSTLHPPASAGLRSGQGQ
jgi:hypothetical protein